MRTYRLLYFRDSVLDRAEEVQVPSVIEAVQKAAGQPDDVRVEVWSETGGRVATIQPSRRL